MIKSFTLNLGKFKEVGIGVPGSDAPRVLTSENGFDGIIKGSFKFTEYPEGSGTYIFQAIEIDVSELGAEINRLDGTALITTGVVSGNTIFINFAGSGQD